MQAFFYICLISIGLLRWTHIHAEQPTPLLSSILNSGPISEIAAKNAGSLDLKDWRKLVLNTYKKNWRSLHDPIEQKLFYSAVEQLKCQAPGTSKTKPKSCRLGDLSSLGISHFENYSTLRQQLLPVEETPLEKKSRKLVRRKIRGIGRVSPIRYVLWRYPNQAMERVIKLFSFYKMHDDAISSEITSYTINIKQARAELRTTELEIRDQIERLQSFYLSKELIENDLISSTQIKIEELRTRRVELLKSIYGDNFEEIAQKKQRLKELEGHLVDRERLSVGRRTELYEEYEDLSDEIDTLERSNSSLSQVSLFDGDRARFFARRFAFEVKALSYASPTEFGDLRLADVLAIAFIKGMISEKHAELLYDREIYSEPYQSFLARTGLLLLSSARAIGTAFPLTAPYVILGGALWDAHQQSKFIKRENDSEVRIVQ